MSTSHVRGIIRKKGMAVAYSLALPKSLLVMLAATWAVSVGMWALWVFHFRPKILDSDISSCPIDGCYTSTIPDTMFFSRIRRALRKTPVSKHAWNIQACTEIRFVDRWKFNTHSVEHCWEIDCNGTIPIVFRRLGDVIILARMIDRVIGRTTVFQYIFRPLLTDKMG
jgi:hypothetical protein